MGTITDINRDFRRLPLTHLRNLQCDIAKATIHHTLNPSQNYIQVEFKLPALSKMMPSEDYESIVRTYFHDCMHEMKYIEVSNKEFHAFMHNEGQKWHTTDGNLHVNDDDIDIVRSKRDNKIVTNYYSNSRLLGLLHHDYYMGLILYMNYPIRDFIHQTPCKKPSKYDKCAIPTLVRGVVGWLHDAQEFFPNIEKTFFSFIEDNHRLCMGYTEDPIPHSGITCGIPDEPRYFIIDLNVLYFKHATFNKEAWKNKIINNRRSCTEELYYLDSGDIISDDICGTKFSPPYKNVNADGETIPSARTSYQGYVGYGRVIPYRTRYRKETPAVLWSAISNNDFDALWLQDAFAFNGRNDLFKWNFNHWSRIGTYSEDGWVCGWNISEQLGAAGLSQSEIQAQGQQYYNLMGGGDISDTSSSDTEYILLQPIEDGYSYDKFLEPLPKRESAFGLS